MKGARRARRAAGMGPPVAGFAELTSNDPPQGRVPGVFASTDPSQTAVGLHRELADRVSDAFRDTNDGSVASSTRSAKDGDPNALLCESPASGADVSGIERGANSNTPGMNQEQRTNSFFLDHGSRGSQTPDRTGRRHAVADDDDWTSMLNAPSPRGSIRSSRSVRSNLSVRSPPRSPAPDATNRIPPEAVVEDKASIAGQSSEPHAHEKPQMSSLALHSSSVKTDEAPAVSPAHYSNDAGLDDTAASHPSAVPIGQQDTTRVTPTAPVHESSNPYAVHVETQQDIVVSANVPAKGGGEESAQVDPIGSSDPTESPLDCKERQADPHGDISSREPAQVPAAVPLGGSDRVAAVWNAMPDCESVAQGRDEASASGDGAQEDEAAVQPGGFEAPSVVASVSEAKRDGAGATIANDKDLFVQSPAVSRPSEADTALASREKEMFSDTTEMNPTPDADATPLPAEGDMEAAADISRAPKSEGPAPPASSGNSILAQSDSTSRDPASHDPSAIAHSYDSMSPFETESATTATVEVAPPIDQEHIETAQPKGVVEPTVEGTAAAHTESSAAFQPIAFAAPIVQTNPMSAPQASDPAVESEKDKSESVGTEKDTQSKSTVVPSFLSGWEGADGWGAGWGDDDDDDDDDDDAVSFFQGTKIELPTAEQPSTISNRSQGAVVESPPPRNADETQSGEIQNTSIAPVYTSVTSSPLANLESTAKTHGENPQSRRPATVEANSTVPSREDTSTSGASALATAPRDDESEPHEGFGQRGIPLKPAGAAVDGFETRTQTTTPEVVTNSLEDASAPAGASLAGRPNPGVARPDPPAINWEWPSETDPEATAHGPTEDAVRVGFDFGDGGEPQGTGSASNAETMTTAVSSAPGRPSDSALVREAEQQGDAVVHDTFPAQEDGLAPNQGRAATTSGANGEHRATAEAQGGDTDFLGGGNGWSWSPIEVKNGSVAATEASVAMHPLAGSAQNGHADALGRSNEAPQAASNAAMDAAERSVAATAGSSAPSEASSWWRDPDRHETSTIDDTYAGSIATIGDASASALPDTAEDTRFVPFPAPSVASDVDGDIPAVSDEAMAPGEGEAEASGIGMSGKLQDPPENSARLGASLPRPDKHHVGPSSGLNDERPTELESHAPVASENPQAAAHDREDGPGTEKDAHLTVGSVGSVAGPEAATSATGITPGEQLIHSPATALPESYAPSPKPTAAEQVERQPLSAPSAQVSGSGPSNVDEGSHSAGAEVSQNAYDTTNWFGPATLQDETGESQTTVSWFESGFQPTEPEPTEWIGQESATHEQQVSSSAHQGTPGTGLSAAERKSAEVDSSMTRPSSTALESAQVSPPAPPNEFQSVSHPEQLPVAHNGDALHREMFEIPDVDQAAPSSDTVRASDPYAPVSSGAPEQPGASGSNPPALGEADADQYAPRHLRGMSSPSPVEVASVPDSASTWPSGTSRADSNREQTPSAAPELPAQGYNQVPSQVMDGPAYSEDTSPFAPFAPVSHQNSPNSSPFFAETPSDPFSTPAVAQSFAPEGAPDDTQISDQPSRATVAASASGEFAPEADNAPSSIAAAFDQGERPHQDPANQPLADAFAPAQTRAGQTSGFEVGMGTAPEDPPAFQFAPAPNSDLPMGHDGITAMQPDTLPSNTVETSEPSYVGEPEAQAAINSPANTTAVAPGAEPEINSTAAQQIPAADFAPVSKEAQPNNTELSGQDPATSGASFVQVPQTQEFPPPDPFAFAPVSYGDASGPDTGETTQNSTQGTVQADPLSSKNGAGESAASEISNTPDVSNFPFQHRTGLNPAASQVDHGDAFVPAGVQFTPPLPDSIPAPESELFNALPAPDSSPNTSHPAIAETAPATDRPDARPIESSSAEEYVTPTPEASVNMFQPTALGAFPPSAAPETVLPPAVQDIVPPPVIPDAAPPPMVPDAAPLPTFPDAAPPPTFPDAAPPPTFPDATLPPMIPETTPPPLVPDAAEPPVVPETTPPLLTSAPPPAPVPAFDSTPVDALGAPGAFNPQADMFSIMDTGVPVGIHNDARSCFVTWGFGGSIVVYGKNANTAAMDSPGHSLSIYDAADIARNTNDADWAAASIEIDADAGQADANLPIERVCEQIQSQGSGQSSDEIESRAVLWRLLRAMNDAPQRDRRALGRPALMGSSDVKLYARDGAPDATGAKVDSPLHQEPEKSPEMKMSQARAAAEVESLLLEGDAIGAASCAAQASHWPLALAAAYSASPDMLLQVISDYARANVVEGTPLQMFLLALAGNTDEVLRVSTTADGLKNWRRTAAVVMDCDNGMHVNGGENQALSKLGDALKAEGNLIAAHVCYLLSGKTLELSKDGLQESGAVALLGGDISAVCGRPGSFGSSAVVLQSLAFETVCQSSGRARALHLLPFRLVLAYEMTAIGNTKSALALCTSTIEAVKRLFSEQHEYSQLLTAPFLSCLEGLEHRLRSLHGDGVKHERQILSRLRPSISKVFQRAGVPAFRKPTDSHTIESRRAAASQVPMSPESLHLPPSVLHNPPMPAAQDISMHEPGTAHGLGAPQVLPPTASMPVLPRVEAAAPPVAPQVEARPESPPQEGHRRSSSWTTTTSLMASAIRTLAPEEVSPPPVRPGANGWGDTSTLDSSHPSGVPVPPANLGMSSLQANTAVYGAEGQPMQHSQPAGVYGSPQFPPISQGPPGPPVSHTASQSSVEGMSQSLSQPNASHSSSSRPPLPPAQSRSAERTNDGDTQSDAGSSQSRGWSLGVGSMLKTRILDKMPTVVPRRKRAYLGDESKFVFNKELGKWVEEGNEAAAEDDVPPPPPDDEDAGLGDNGGYSQPSADNTDPYPTPGSGVSEYMNGVQDSTAFMSSDNQPASLNFPAEPAPLSHSYDPSPGPGLASEATHSQSPSVTSAPSPFQTTPPNPLSARRGSPSTASSLPGQSSGNKFRAPRRSGRAAYVDTFNPGASASAQPGPGVRPPGIRPPGIATAGAGPPQPGPAVPKYNIFTPMPASPNLGPGAASSADNVSATSESTARPV